MATFWAVDSQEKDALIINLAGRQRMLVRQMTGDVLQIERGGGEEYAQSLREAADTFDRTLWALINGGQAPYLSGRSVGVPATRDADILTGLQQVDHSWDTFRAHLDAIMLAAPGSPEFTAAVRAVERLSPSLVQQADDVVRLYESASAQKVSRLRWIQVAFLVSALALLAVGFLVTRESVLKPLRLLGLAAERIGRGNLDAPVKVPGPREIQTLAYNLDGMRVQLKAGREELETRVDRRTRELAALYEVSRDISSRLQIDQVLRSVTDKARELLDSEVALLCLLDESAQSLSLEAFSGPEGAVFAKRTSAQKPPANFVLAGESALVCGVEGCAGSCGVIAPAFRTSHLAAPLRAGERVIGALCVGSSTAEAFAAEDAGLLTKLANSAAIALENARLYQQAERVAMLEERQRIAAEMHDGLAQTLSYLELKSEGLVELVKAGRGEEVAGELERMCAALAQTNQEVRQSIASLQARAMPSRSLQERLAEAVAEFARAGGPPVELAAELEPTWQLPADEIEQVMRVVQEALQNVRRHAQARHVAVRLERRGDELVAAVQDDGQGFDPKAPSADGSGHFGLSIMRARAARIGGRLEVETKPGRGTRVILSWPIGGSNDGPATGA